MTAGKTVPELTAETPPIVGTDEVVVYRSPGPLKRATAATVRTYMQSNLGTMATQNANAVAITGGSITGITDLAVADGGTGAGTADGALTNFGATTVGKAVFTAADAAAARTATGTVIGTDVQAYDADLAAIAALTSAADKMPYATGAQTWAMADLTSFARTLLATANNSAFLAALGQIDVVETDFLQAGTGAVTRTGQAKLREFKTGGDYGATGDGVADDTAELQALLTAGAGGVVFLPIANGEYKITSTLTVPANTWIEGMGGQITSTMTSATDAVLFMDGGGARNLTVVGPYPSGGTYTGDNNGIACRGTNNSPAAPTVVVAPVFENVEVYGYGHTGIRLQYCKNSFSANVVVRNCGYAGVGGLSCENVWIDGYRADNITPGVSTDAYGVFFDRSEAGTLTADPTSYRCGATNVIITNVRGGGNGQGVDSHGGVEIVFEGIVNDCDVAGAFTASSVSDSQVIGPKRCRAKITGESNNEGYGFFVVGAVSGGSTIDYAEDCEVDLNLTGYGKEIADGSIGAGYFVSTKQLKVRGQLKNPRSCGLYFGKDNYGLDVDVAVTDPNSTAFSAAGCIRVVGINNTGRIQGTYRFENAALATYVAVTSIRVEAGLTGLDLDFGPSGFDGLSATCLNAQFNTTTGVRYYGMQTQTGGADITASSGVADGILDVTFAKRFPYVPSVQATLNFPVNGGGKFPILAVRDVLVTETGFRIYAYPTDGTTWSATGTVPFRWEAK